MLRIKRRKAKSFQASIGQIAELCDVLFRGVDPKDDKEVRPGWVRICASKKGQRAVEAVFPSAHIEWRYYTDNALGWAEFSINLPEVAGAGPDHRLPLEITGGVSLDDALPDVLAFLLAMAAQRQGARVAVEDCTGIINFYSGAEQ
jgi:hypothetical protein